LDPGGFYAEILNPLGKKEREKVARKEILSTIGGALNFGKREGKYAEHA